MSADPRGPLSAFPRREFQEGYAGRPLRNRKGGDMAEWPEALRVREMPATP